METKPTALIARDGNRVVFRSKLEAHWAYFFDLMGFAWKYEPFRFPLNDKGLTYTPDFEVDGIGLIEVKPNGRTVKDSIGRIARYIEKTGGRVYLFCGSKPSATTVSIFHGSPLQELYLSVMQQTIIFGGVQRRELAKSNFPLFQDSLRIALTQASGRLTFDLIIIGEQMALDDTREFSYNGASQAIEVRQISKAVAKQVLKRAAA